MYGPTKQDITIRLAAISAAMLVFTIACAVAFAIGLSGCTTTPDGRRVLTPGARAVGGAVLEDVLACGGPLLAGALAGEPDYVAASTCHLSRVAARVGERTESAPAPSEEHGRDVLRAAVLEHQGDHLEAKAVARACEATARAKLASEAVQP